MRRLQFRSLLLLLTAASSAPAASLHYLPEDQLLIVDGQRFELSIENPLEEMRDLRADAARGHLDKERSKRLGELLLGPARELLQHDARWIIAPPEMAPLGALQLPWSDNLVVEEIELVYRFDSDVPVSSNVSGRGVFVVAPLVEGYDDLIDMPDTLLWELRNVEKHVELAPRNDSEPAGLAAALGGRSYGLSWLRALPEQADSLAPLLLSSAPLILWTHPHETVDPLRVFSTVRPWVIPGRVVCLDLWNRSEGRAAAGWSKFFERLASGDDVAGALAVARRAQVQRGEIEQWAAWICLGDGSIGMEFEAPSRWRRWLNGLRSRR